MHTDQTLLELVGRVYDAAADPAQWDPFLQKLKEIFGAPWCVFYVHDFSDQKVDVKAEIGFDPAYVDSYQGYYASKNPTLCHGKELLQPGKVWPTQLLCPLNILARSEFYQDWAAPQHIGAGITATVLRAPSFVGLFGVLQELGAKPFEECDMALLRALMPHLQRAVQLHQRLAELNSLQQGARDALDRWSLGVILLDSKGAVLLMNRAAEELVDRRDGVAVDGGRLRASRADETATLRALIDGARVAQQVPSSDPGGVMAVSRADSERPLRLFVAPLPPNRKVLSSRGAACVVFVSNPAASATSDERLLQRLYDLTPAEARVAALLVQGKNVKRISDELRVTPNTARTHVKRVLRKTDTRRQSELIALIFSDPTSSRLT